MRMIALAQMMAATLAVLPLFAASRGLAETPQIGDPISHENVSVFLLKGRSAPGPVPLTLAEALAKGAIEVHETGNVRELKIENKGDAPVFVQLGDIVKGGRQDRVLTVSLELAPHSGEVPIGAFCVEQGRWSARRGEDDRKFAASENMLPSRSAKVAIASPPAAPVPDASDTAQASNAPRPRSPIESELNQARRRDADQRVFEQRVDGLMRRPDGQDEVWRNVGLLQRQLSANLKTTVESDRSRTSLQLSLENDKLQAEQSAYIGALEPAGLKDDDVIGVAFAIGGRVTSAEIYPSNGLFRKMWPKLVRAAATEALAETDRSAKPAPTSKSVANFLADGDRGTPGERKIGGLATLLTRHADKVLSVTASTTKGSLVHRSYLAK